LYLYDFYVSNPVAFVRHLYWLFTPPFSFILGLS